MKFDVIYGPEEELFHFRLHFDITPDRPNSSAS